jgi:hypothetical protein
MSIGSLAPLVFIVIDTSLTGLGIHFYHLYLHSDILV